MTGALRVLLLNENIGGHATVHRALADALQALPGVEADFLHLPPPTLGARLASLPVPGLAHLDLDLQPLRAQLARATWARHALQRRLDRGDVDVLHVYTQNAALLCAGLLERVPTVVSTDSTNTLNAYRLPYRSPTRFTRFGVVPAAALERRVLDRARLVLASSGYVAASLRERYGVGPDRLRVLPVGVRLPPAPAERPRRRPVVVFVGHQLERKGGRRLLDLHARHLADECDLVLVTTEPVGPVGPGVRVVDDVREAGPRLHEVLAGADVMCFPSTIDQAPNAVLEGAAMGLPVVAHPVGGIPEMVLHGSTGLLVAPHDDDALLDALRTLLRDGALRRRLGAQARRHVEQHFDTTRLVREHLVPLLHEAAGRPVTGR